MKTIVTYCDENYVNRAIVLIDSILKYYNKDVRIVCICYDEITRLIIGKLFNEKVVAVGLHEIELGDYSLEAAKENRSFFEYYWTLTPSIIVWAMNHFSDSEHIIYTDADTRFYGPLDELFSEMGDASVLIHEHRYQEKMKVFEEMSGRFNVGLMVFKSDTRARLVLSSWRRECNEWCYARFEKGKFGDQKYLERWPTDYEGVHILESLSVGAAPWNQENYIFAKTESGITVNNQPMVHFHFHGFEIPYEGLYMLFKYNYFLSRNVVEELYIDYVNAIENSIKRIRNYFPSAQLGIGKGSKDLHSRWVLRRTNRHLDRSKGELLGPVLDEVDPEWILQGINEEELDFIKSPEFTKQSKEVAVPKAFEEAGAAIKNQDFQLAEKALRQAWLYEVGSKEIEYSIALVGYQHLAVNADDEKLARKVISQLELSRIARSTDAKVYHYLLNLYQKTDNELRFAEILKELEAKYPQDSMLEIYKEKAFARETVRVN